MKKRVWLNINTGTFSQSWEQGSILDLTLEVDILEKALSRGFKLLEYTCINDPDFELYDKMKIVTNTKPTTP